MAFTPEGLSWVGDWIASELVGQAWIVVSDGKGESAVATISEAKLVVRDDGGAAVVCQALFDSAEANFEWAQHDVKLKDGTVVDREVEDLGRKASPSIWALTVSMTVAPGRTTA